MGIDKKGWGRKKGGDGEKRWGLERCEQTNVGTNKQVRYEKTNWGPVGP